MVARAGRSCSTRRRTRHAARQKLADHTHILVFSDFCRTPQINLSGGRDHYPNNSALVISPKFARGRSFGKTDRRAAAARRLRPQIRGRPASDRAARSARDVPARVRRSIRARTCATARSCRRCSCEARAAHCSSSHVLRHAPPPVALTPGPSFPDARADQIVEQGDLAYLLQAANRDHDRARRHRDHRRRARAAAFASRARVDERRVDPRARRRRPLDRRDALRRHVVARDDERRARVDRRSLSRRRSRDAGRQLWPDDRAGARRRDRHHCRRRARLALSNRRRARGRHQPARDRDRDRHRAVGPREEHAHHVRGRRSCRRSSTVPGPSRGSS